jgi:hypothetical protein
VLEHAPEPVAHSEPRGRGEERVEPSHRLPPARPVR